MILATPDSAGGRQDKRRSGVRQNSREMARLTDGPKPGTPPPPRSPFLPPAPRPQLPPAAPALQQRAAAALILALLSLIAMLLIGNLQRAVYVIAVALAVAVVGLVLAISAMKAAKRAGTRRPRVAMASVVLGAAGAAVLRVRACRAADLLVAVHAVRQVPGRREHDRRAECLPAAVRELDRSPDHPPRQPVTGLPRSRLLLLVPVAHGLTWMRWPPASSVSSTMSAGSGALTRAGSGAPRSACGPLVPDASWLVRLARR